jgi:mannose-1-phosphate guanylyltransferase
LFYALIMAGGSGTRLWPLSRNDRPKQILTLVGNRSMFQSAIDRLNPLFNFENIFVVTREDQCAALSTQVPDLPVGNFINEPIGRGTAPAIGLAAIHLRKNDPDAVMAVLTADHFIKNKELFQKALEKGYQLANKGYLVTLGIKPTNPSTGFGYIHHGPALPSTSSLPVFSIHRFVEKPDAQTARMMVSDGDHSWNSGMFIWRVNRILDEIQRQMPELYAQLVKIENSIGKKEYSNEIRKVWPEVKKQTIDYGVMEHASNAVVIPVDIGWIDVGSWASMNELYQPDEKENIITGPFVGIDSSNLTVINDGRLVAAIGIKDLVVVETKDTVLICAKEREQEVREIVEHLKTDEKLQRWL